MKHPNFVAGSPLSKINETVTSIKGGTVSDAEWDLIAEFMPNPKEVNREDVHTFEVDLANDQIDRDNDRFSNEVLKSFSKTLPGKGFLIGHSWGPPGKGLFYQARITTVDGVKWLRGKFYVLKTYSQSLIDHINAGIYKYVSIGFTAPAVRRIAAEEESNSFGTAHWEYRNSKEEEAEALEGSLVWLGAQHDAQVRKFLSEKAKQEFGDDNNNQEIELMKMAIKSLGLKDLDVTDDNKIIETQAAIENAVNEIIADQQIDDKFLAGLKGIFKSETDVELAEIKAAKDTADKYKKHLVDEVVKFAALLKMVPEDETELAAEKKELAELSTDRLERQLKTYKDKYVKENPGYSEIGDPADDKDDKDGVVELEVSDIEI